MRPFPVAAIVVGAAVTVSLAADVFDASGVQLTARAVAMLAAAGYVVTAGIWAPRMRWSLGVFLLLWAAVAMAQLLGELAPEPALAPLGANGCPTGVDTSLGVRSCVSLN
ncbi:hypothetical protein [Jidongwangia harbinensis]|uniref:hypothetical protein n=1 Tax=Jidongwangia harbinensis TaxID=2878561 RepID=UPI001CDA318E|nr:hypothetical protein [Jidongwangia harbinensis]MCA2212589.1 hypothetical protein [Jidongwangia harbinensis]